MWTWHLVRAGISFCMISVKILRVGIVFELATYKLIQLSLAIEINMKGSGRVEYVFAGINEQIEIKLQSQYFSNVETHKETCSRKEGYSDIKV